MAAVCLTCSAFFFDLDFLRKALGLDMMMAKDRRYPRLFRVKLMRSHRRKDACSYYAMLCTVVDGSWRILDLEHSVPRRSNQMILAA